MQSIAFFIFKHYICKPAEGIFINKKDVDFCFGGS